MVVGRETHGNDMIIVLYVTNDSIGRMYDSRRWEEQSDYPDPL